MKRGPRKISIPGGRNASISLCMIVRNESETIERCLQAARDHVEEVVVVDTGSTDGTQEIAARYADVLDEIVWPGSFSVARNYSLDLASGDYVLILDGDEYLEGDEKWELLRSRLNPKRVAAIQLPVLNLLPESGIVAADRLWQERVFLNDRRLRYTGSVHNQIQDTIGEFAARTLTEVVRAEAEVVHTGYALSPERMKEKYQPRLDLLLSEYNNPRSQTYRAYYGYQLGVVYYVLQDYASAFRVFDELEYAYLSDINAFYTHMLAAQTGLKLKYVDRALLHCNAMLTLDRHEPVAFYTTGFALLGRSSLIDGMLMLAEAYNVNAASGSSARFVLNSRVLLRTVADVCRKVGLLQHAEQFHENANADQVDESNVVRLIEGLKSGLVHAQVSNAA